MNSIHHRLIQPLFQR